MIYGPGWFALALCGGLSVMGCGGPGQGPASFDAFRDAGAAMEVGSPAANIRHVFVVAMENHDAVQVYGDGADAPYINETLIPISARATNFQDELPGAPSEPHYVWMEAGTNVFADHTFTVDSDPSSDNSTSSGAHLVGQIHAAGDRLTWTSYQEGLDASTGSCPIAGAAVYVPRHDPFVFFQDVTGEPPSKDSAYCVSHHKDLSALARDLTDGTVSVYNFVSPNLCHDMHGSSLCPDSDVVRSGDDWLAANLPALIDFANANAGVIFIVWDEAQATHRLPFLAIGPRVKAGYASTVEYNHSSLLKTVETILGLPIMPVAAASNDLSDLFQGSLQR